MAVLIKNTGYKVTAKSTQHGDKTPFGFKTPHRFPGSEEIKKVEESIELVKQLLPTGRAFYMPEQGIFEQLHIAINRQFIQLQDDADNIKNQYFPDNENFTEQDAKLWEYRYGMFPNSTGSLESRKEAILRKMSYPQNKKERGHYLFIENQLRLSGFNVRVYENSFEENGEIVYKTPAEITDSSVSEIQHADDLQHGGGTQHGSSGFDVIANSIYPNESYSVGGYENLYATFFIAGEQINQTASLPESREQEFRELVLKLKPAHSVAFLIANFNLGTFSR